MPTRFRRLTLAASLALAAAAALAQAAATDGEVRKIDKAAGKITLKHGKIKNLDMPGMTMVFTARDKALLDRVRPGDRVKFRAEKEGGQFVVTAIDTVP